VGFAAKWLRRPNSTVNIRARWVRGLLTAWDHTLVIRGRACFVVSRERVPQAMATIEPWQQLAAELARSVAVAARRLVTGGPPNAA
jgi:hypothetical protein